MVFLEVADATQIETPGPKMRMQWCQWWTATRVTGMELETGKYFGLGIDVFVGSWICIHDLQLFLFIFISKLCIFVCNLTHQC